MICVYKILWTFSANKKILIFLQMYLKVFLQIKEKKKKWKAREESVFYNEPGFSFLKWIVNKE